MNGLLLLLKTWQFLTTKSWAHFLLCDSSFFIHSSETRNWNCEVKFLIKCIFASNKWISNLFSESSSAGGPLNLLIREFLPALILATAKLQLFSCILTCGVINSQYSSDFADRSFQDFCGICYTSSVINRLKIMIIVLQLWSLMMLIWKKQRSQSCLRSQTQDFQ